MEDSIYRGCTQAQRTVDRLANDVLERYELFAGDGVDPDPEVDSPLETFKSLPHTTGDLVIDDFICADDPTLGTAWTEFGEAGGGVGIRIKSNKAHCERIDASNSDYGFAMNNVLLTGVGIRITFALKFGNAVGYGGNEHFRIYWRSQSSSNDDDGYFAIFYPEYLDLFRAVGGANTFIAEVVLTLGTAEHDIQIDCDTITGGVQNVIRIDNVIKLNNTDTNAARITADGYVGLYMNTSKDSAANTIDVGDLIGSDKTGMAYPKTWHLLLIKRNAYNLKSLQVGGIQIIEIDGAGHLAQPNPDAPSDPLIEAAAGGAFRLTAHSNYTSYPNSIWKWEIWYTSNGSTPNPSGGPATQEVDFVLSDGLGKLDWTSAAFADATTIKAIVRVRRDTVYESQNVNVLTIVTDTDGPAAPTGQLWIGDANGQEQ
jgi:hypothetical protein